jgi:hypothetical protein
MSDTERSIYVGVFVVEHAPGTGRELDDPPKPWLSGVRANLVDWLAGVVLNDQATNADGSLFYAVRDVTLYHEADFTAELVEHKSIAQFPDVRLHPPSTELES